MTRKRPADNKLYKMTDNNAEPPYVLVGTVTDLEWYFVLAFNKRGSDKLIAKLTQLTYPHDTTYYNQLKIEYLGEL